MAYRLVKSPTELRELNCLQFGGEARITALIVTPIEFVWI